MSVKFFSPEWRELATAAANASDTMQAGFKDPSAFTNRMAFAVIGRDDLTTHVEWKEGKIVTWTGADFPEDDLWLVITGSLDTWKAAASGVTEGGSLLMAGKIKFAKGPMSAAIENAGAFNAYLLSWGQVDTDWDV